MSDLIQNVTMPKWGLSMTEGRLNDWLVKEGAEVAVGEEIAEVETEKITGAVESPVAGPLRRIVGQPGEMISVGGLLAVVAPQQVTEAEIDAHIEAFLASFVPEGVEDEDEGGAAGESLDLAVGTVRVLSNGQEGEAMLFIHGFGGDAQNWMFNIGAFDGHAVSALDLPGHGGSTKAVAGGLEGLIASVQQLLDGRGIERVHLVGHSMGGLIAAEVAVRSPALVASLSMIDPAGLGPEISTAYIDGFIDAESRRELKPVLQMLFADPELVSRSMVDDVLRYKRLDGVQEALAALRDEMFPHGHQQRAITNELTDSRVPVLVIWGEQDQVIPPAHAANAPEGARVELIAGVGHSPHLEAAGEVNRLIAEHLRTAASDAVSG